MKKSQKIILSLVSIVVLGAGVVFAYAIKVAEDAKQTVANIEGSIDREVRPVNYEAQDPVSILLMGVDEGTVTGELDRTTDYVGRSDSLMYVTLNPKNKQTTIVSMDRDLYVQITGKTRDSGAPLYAKLNESYSYGAGDGAGEIGSAETTIATVENMLDVPVDHYVSINMQGMEDLIDAVGGITVDNQYHFELDGVELYPGVQELDGKSGLAYARFRKYDASTGMGDPEGDVGRQKRQREVVELIVRKILSLNSVTNYQKIFTAIEDNVVTDLTWDQMLNIAQGYTSVLDNIVPLQLQGQYHWFDGYYQLLPINELLDIQNALKTQLDLPNVDSLAAMESFDNQEYYFDDTNLDADAGEREGIDDNLYFDGQILRPYQSIWTRDSYPENALTQSTTETSGSATETTATSEIAQVE